MTEDRDNPATTASWIAMVIRAVLVYLVPVILITIEEWCYARFFSAAIRPSGWGEPFARSIFRTFG